MTPNPPILRNSALLVPVAVIWGAYWSAEHALAAALSSALVLANLWALSILGPRLVKSLASEESPVLWVGALAAKFVVVVAAFLGLVRVLPPLGVGLGFVPLILGTLLTAIQLARVEDRSVVGEA